ncbi:MAG: inorganic phosphate transporter [Myxococcaceae bacterium]|nr:MAG: inorganic phosphate transporter [Myxococcaceae bacterium]
MIDPLLVVPCLLVAFANGANDNAKGIAPLVGSGAASMSRAIRWGNVTTLLGATAAVYVALHINQDLVRAFSGGGLLPVDVLVHGSTPAAIALGAAATVLAATRLGIPVSTTHALMGALVGVGLVEVGPGRIVWARLAAKFVAPLLLSPFLAAVASLIAYSVLRSARRRMRAAAPSENRAAALRGALWVSTGAASFARGMNDAPKIAGLLLSAASLSLVPSLLSVAGVMFCGGLLFTTRVATTMARRVTRMDTEQALASSVVTATLVILASRSGLPVSTTHVSVGALIGIGVSNKTADWTTIGGIVMAWVATLPLAIALGAGAAVVLR